MGLFKRSFWGRHLSEEPLTEVRTIPLSSIQPIVDSKTGLYREFAYKGRYATNGYQVFVVNQYYIYLEGSGFLVITGNVSSKLCYDIVSCVPTNYRGILSYATPLNHEDLDIFKYVRIHEFKNQLEFRGMFVDLSRVRAIQSDEIYKKLYGSSFRYLSKEESFAAWKIFGY